MKIAILALQGAFLEHEQMLHRLGVETFEIRQRVDWDQPKDGLIIPGGESTTMLKLLHDLELFEPIRDAILGGLPVFGTCAGLILLSSHVEGDDIVRLGTMDMTVRRNAYGRQLGSFYTEAPMAGIGCPVPMTFIRAPYIVSVGAKAEVLAEVSGHIVAARQGTQLVTAFHPELNDATLVHEYFVRMITEAQAKS
jgi:5'-phosphate synthase pdxT subunit